jgi:predicted extracellular nuclease
MVISATGGAILASRPPRQQPGTPKAPSAPATPTPTTPDGQLRVSTFNVENFFDTVDNPATNDQLPTSAQYDVKLKKLALALTGKLGLPDVLGLEEVENEQVLKDLLARPELKSAGYQVIMRPSNDRRGINVAMLYKSARLNPTNIEQFNPVVKLPDNAAGEIDPTLLYPRSPLVVDFEVRGASQAKEGAQQLTVIVNHFKSKLGGPGPEPRRQAEGELLGGFVDARRAAQPNRPVIVMGDLNASYSDGAFTKLANRPDGTARLYDTPMSMPEGDRYSYNYRGKTDMLDHLLVTPDAQSALVKAEIPHFNSPRDAPKRANDPKFADGVSDHDPIVATFDLAKLAAASVQPKH